MIAKSGFSLIEVLLYCVLLSVLVTFLFGWVHKTQSSLKNESSMIMNYMGDCAAIDRLAHDLRQAPAALDHWARMHSNEIIWYTGKTYIGWKLTGSQLARYEGVFKDAQWVDYTRSLIHEQIHKISFECLPRESKEASSKELGAIHIVLNGMRCTVKPRNGQLYDEK